MRAVYSLCLITLVVLALIGIGYAMGNADGRALCAIYLPD